MTAQDAGPEGDMGLYGKYTVINNATGEQVTDCFVLRPDRDVSALHALEAYVSHCWHDEALQTDLRAWAARLWSERHMLPRPAAPSEEE